MNRLRVLFVCLFCLAALVGGCGGSGGGEQTPEPLNLEVTLIYPYNGTIGSWFSDSVMFLAWGGVPPYAYSCSIPEESGFTVSVGDPDPVFGHVPCVISGTPLLAGSFMVDVSARDSVGTETSASVLAVEISPPNLYLTTDRASLDIVMVGTPYNQSVRMLASGGMAPYVYACSITEETDLTVSVGDPDPITGEVPCLISGTSLSVETYTLNFSVLDSVGTEASATPLALHFRPPLGPLDNWHSRNPLPQGNTLESVAYGTNVYVAVGGGGAIVTSPDGVDWTNRASGTTEWLSDITYGSRVFVAVGSAGTILTSPDGITWESQNSGTAADLAGITWGGGMFVAVGELGLIFTSSDGITWERTPAGCPEDWIPDCRLNSVTYGDGTFVAMGQGWHRGWLTPSFWDLSLASRDGTTWINRTPEIYSPVIAVAYGDGTFVAAERFLNAIWSSTDAVTWTKGLVAGSFSGVFKGIAYGGGTFVVVGDVHDYGIGALGARGPVFTLTSPDGETWTPRSSGTQYELHGVTYGGGTFVAVGVGGSIVQSDPIR